MTLQLEHFILGELSTNCYLIHDGAGLFSSIRYSFLGDKRGNRARNLGLRYIISTHSYPYRGNAFFKEHFPQAQLVIGEKRPDLFD